MSILFADGFDCYNDLADALRAGWWQESDSFTINTTGGKFGGGAMSIGAGSTYMSRPITAATGRTIYICGHYKHGGTGGATDIIIRGWGVTRSTSIFTLRHNTAGDITLLAGATSVATASAAIPSGAYAWIELKVVLGTTTGNGLMELRVNEAVVATSASTINTNTAVGQISFGGTAGASPGLWDDIYICDDQGSSPVNTYPATIRIDTLTPNAAGASNSWSNDYTYVDDATPDDGDTTYVAATSAATKANYSVSNLLVNPTTIFGVQVKAKVKKSDVGLKTLRAYLRSNATDSVGPTVTAYSDYNWISTGPIITDPNTATNWTASGVNAVYAGIEVVS